MLELVDSAIVLQELLNTDSSICRGRWTLRQGSGSVRPILRLPSLPRYEGAQGTGSIYRGLMVAFLSFSTQTLFPFVLPCEFLLHGIPQNVFQLHVVVRVHAHIFTITLVTLVAVANQHRFLIDFLPSLHAEVPFTLHDQQISMGRKGENM